MVIAVILPFTKTLVFLQQNDNNCCLSGYNLNETSYGQCKKVSAALSRFSITQLVD